MKFEPQLSGFTQLYSTSLSQMSILTSPENSLPNPLLSRTKLKPIKKSKSKTKSSKSSSPLPPATPIEELETDSLADSLLEQLDIKEAEVPAVVKPAWLHKEEHHQEKEKSQGTFGFIKGKLSNISIAAGGDKKASRQELRKVSLNSALI